MNTEIILDQFTDKQWWWSKRGKYNKGLLWSGFIAFLLYNILGPIIIAPHEEFDETGVLMVIHGFAYLTMMAIANVFYTLGWLIDITLNKNNSQLFRERLFVVGFWFSVTLPSLAVLGIMLRFLLM